MSDSDNEADLEYGLEKYSLVRFIHKGRKRKTESFDIVPSKWLDFDKKKARCVTKFMDEPYNDEDLKLIHDLVMKNADAPEDWPTFPIEQVGRARTYKEGVAKLKQLEIQEHVLTLESEDSASEAQRQLTLAVKRRKLLDEANKLHGTFLLANKDTQVKGITDTSDDTQSVQPKKKLTGKGKDPASQCKKPSKSSAAFSKHVPDGEEDDKVNSRDETKTATLEDDAPFEKRSSLTNGSVVLESIPKVVPSTSSAGLLLESMPFVDQNVIIDAPIQFDNVECKTPFEVAVMMRLDIICTDLAEMKLQVTSIKNAQEATTNFLSDKKLVSRSLTDLEKKYQVRIPLATYEDFEAFEHKFTMDSFFKKDIYAELKLYADKDYGISKSIVKMVKRFMTKDLASQFTAIRTSPKDKTKYKFRPTTFCAIIETVITRLRNEKSLNISLEDFNASLIDVFTNIARWK